MEAPPAGVAVCVRDAFKYYGSSKNPKIVLDRLNMTVPKGTIYGLLGASGCGKTTLLTCIVGRRRLKSGEVMVLGGRPGTRGSGVPGPRVGYMPQDIALFSDFSIRDTMFYFGKIFAMSTEEVEERSSFLYRLMDLPPPERLVGKLSGGQQRRVSLAAALLHDPELLILDEPTVGVDPVLRQRIWSYLMQITRTGNKTVIITTHYIEEARQAHTIGLMRNGILLAEDSPAELLSMYGCGTLEEVFLLLSRKQGRVSSEAPDTEEEVRALPQTGPPQIRRASAGALEAPISRLEPANNNNISEDSPQVICEMNPLKKRNRASLRGKMSSLLKKNFSRYYRNLSVMLFCAGFPVLQICVFFLAIGHDPQQLPLAVVNDEVPFLEGSSTDYSHESSSIDRCQGLAVPGCNLTKLSCRFLDTLSPSFVNKQYYADQKSAKDAVKAGQVWGALYFGSNFSLGLAERNESGKDTSDEALQMGELGVWLDMSDRQIGILLKKELIDTYKVFFKKLLVDCGMNPKYGEVPVQFNAPVFGTESPSYTIFMAPGVILTVIFFVSTGVTCTTMISEVHEGIWDRALVTGVTAGEILLSHVITQFVVLVVQSLECLLLSFLVFGMDSNGSIFLVTLLTILVGFCGMCFGFLISIVCENISAANYLSIGSFYPMILLCGIMWPLEGMPYGLRVFSLQLPLTRSTDSLRNIIIKGWGFSESAVYDGFIATIIWIIVLLLACFVGLKVKKG